MAIYQTNFGGYALDAQPSDWSARWVTSNSTWAVRADSGAAGGKRLEHTATADAQRLLSWDVIDADSGRADVEVLAKFRSTYSSTTQRELIHLIARASGAAGDETGYRVNLSRSTSTLASNRRIRLQKLVNGTITDLAQVNDLPYEANKWYWLRFRVNGTNLQARFWAEGETEPAGWTVTATDGDITAAGWAGVGRFSQNNIVDWDYVNIATAGDTAVIDNSANALQLYHAPLEALLSGDPAAQLYHAPLEILVQYTGEEPEPPPAGPKYVVVNIVT